MLCQKCGKNDAMIHFTKVVNGYVEEMHLCSLCAETNEEMALGLDMPFPFQKLFTGLIGFSNENKKDIDNSYEVERDGLTCECGLTYKKLKEIGRFGCALCYETFKEELEPLIKGIHGHTKHEGKMPSRISETSFFEKTIETLQNELQDAIRIENFERAALLRDEIKDLRQKMGNI